MVKRDLESILDQTKMKNYNNHSQNAQICDTNVDDQLFLRHLKQQASIILETQDEHLVS
jgi:hypothetical protein